MSTTTTYTPTIRAALLAGLETPAHSFRRAPGGFVPLDPTVANGAQKQHQAFTRRAINQLEREGLVEFDEPGFPCAAILTDAGIEAAKRLKAEYTARRMRQ